MRVGGPPRLLPTQRLPRRSVTVISSRLSISTIRLIGRETSASSPANAMTLPRTSSSASSRRNFLARDRLSKSFYKEILNDLLGPVATARPVLLFLNFLLTIRLLNNKVKGRESSLINYPKMGGCYGRIR